MRSLNRTIQATANNAKRTFTIRTFENGKVVSKYRSFQMDKEEFNDAQFWTQNDWFQFLKTDEYTLV